MRTDRSSREPAGGSIRLHPSGAGTLRAAVWSCGRRLLLGAVVLLGLAVPRAAAAPVRNPNNGHFYDAILVEAGISWEAARAAAAGRTFRGMQGHLATVTTSAENLFITYQFPSAQVYAYWLGGFQQPGIRDPAAGWQWITGEPFGYANWNPEEASEPNDAYGPGTSSQDENKLQFWYSAGGRWNDSRNRDTQNPAYGYVVEFEPDASPDPPSITGYASPLARSEAMTSAPTGAMVVITGANLGRTGTVLFEGVPLPAAVALWSPTEVLAWVPATLTYPLASKVILVQNGKQAEGSAFTITAPTPGRDNLLANGSFEFPDSRASPVDFGFTYGPDWRADPRSFRGWAIPGWRISEGTIDVKRVYWQHAPEQGQQSIDLIGSPGPAVIHQTFFTETSQRYTFSGWVAHNYRVPDSRAAIYLNGIFLGFLSHGGSTSAADMRWTRFSITFPARASQTTLTLRDLTGYTDTAGSATMGTALDGLQVVRATD